MIQIIICEETRLSVYIYIYLTIYTAVTENHGSFAGAAGIRRSDGGNRSDWQPPSHVVYVSGKSNVKVPGEKPSSDD